MKVAEKEGAIKAAQMPSGIWKARWQIRAVLPNGKKHRPSGTEYGKSEAEARRKAQDAAHLAAERSKAFSGPDVARLTVNQLLDLYLGSKGQEEGISARTIKIDSDLARLHLRPALGNLRVADVTAAHAAALKASLAGTAHTAKRAHGLLNQALNHAVFPLRAIVGNPLAAINVRKKRTQRAGNKIKAWDTDEQLRLYQAALLDKTVMGWAIAFALFSGFRRAELLGLTWADVNFHAVPGAKHGTVSVSQAVAKRTAGVRDEDLLTDPKTDRSARTIPLDPRARRALLEVQAWQRGQAKKKGEEWHNPLNLVFTTRKGDLQHADNLTRKINELCQAAGVRRLSPKSTRHTYASALYASGAPISEISRILGHSSTHTTETVYLNFFGTLPPLYVVKSSGQQRADAWREALEQKFAEVEAVTSSPPLTFKPDSQVDSN